MSLGGFWNYVGSIGPQEWNYGVEDHVFFLEETTKASKAMNIALKHRGGLGTDIYGTMYLRPMDLGPQTWLVEET